MVIEATNKDLELLLSENILSASFRERSLFDQLAQPFEKSLVLYGAGSLGKKTLAGLRSLGIEPYAFVDRNKTLWKSKIDGLQVLSPQEAVEQYGSSSVFVVTIWNPEMGKAFSDAKKNLLEFGTVKVVSFIPLYYKYAEEFLPYYSLDLPHKILEQTELVKKAYYLLSDDKSREEYIANLNFRLSGDFTKLGCPVDSLQYFPVDILTLLPNEVFIDCGAYDGDTLKNYLGIKNEFETYIAYEPDPINFEQLLKYTEGLDSKLKSKIKCSHYAVSDTHKWVFFGAKGTAGSSIGVGDLKIECCALDNEIGALNPTYIKMDIEGSEVAALEGAKQCIRNNLPTLGICVYHRPNDLWQIPLLIHSFSKDYEFYLRSHEAEGWDLVCYAIPISRDANASNKQ